MQVEPIQPHGGTKHDQGKPDLTLVDRRAEEGMVRVLEFGKVKYGRNNWMAGFEWTRLIAAAMRHLRAFQEGEDLDPESGLPHLDHAACMIHFASAHQKRGLGTDDRSKVVAVKKCPPRRPGETSSEYSLRMAKGVLA